MNIYFSPNAICYLICTWAKINAYLSLAIKTKSNHPSNHTKMNISKYLLLLVCCLFVAKTVYSQNIPGYQGKRTYLEYNLYSSPILINVDIKGEQFGISSEANTSFGAWNLRHKIDLNYVTKRNSEIGGSVNFGKTGILDENNWLGSIRFTSLGFSYNRYLVKSTGALAPLGRYVRFETQYIQLAASPVNVPRLDYHFVYFGAGIGTRRVYKDFILLNLSMQSGFTIPLTVNQSLRHQEYQPSISSRMFYHFLYEMNIGVGVLLF
jgi:hypothetical protein